MGQATLEFEFWFGVCLPPQGAAVPSVHAPLPKLSVAAKTASKQHPMQSYQAAAAGSAWFAGPTMTLVSVSTTWRYTSLGVSVR